MDQIRRDAMAYDGPVLSGGARGAEIGGITNALRRAAGEVGLDVNWRTARMDFASEALGKTIGSYKELSDGELKAIANWMSGNIVLLAQWLSITYGHTIGMDL